MRATHRAAYRATMFQFTEVPMVTSPASQELESPLSIKWISVALVLFATVLVVVGDTRSDTPERLRVLHFAIAILLAAGVAWQLETTRPTVSRGFAIAALISLLYGGVVWLGAPALLIFSTIPATLAVALLGLRPAVLAAVGQSLLIAWLWRSGAAGALPVWYGLALVALWLNLSIIAVVYKRWVETAQWSLQYSQEIQLLLDGNRDHAAELKETQKDLMVANRTLVLLNVRLASLRRMAEEAEKTKAAFVAKISHEFRTPLNMIIGLIDSLADAPEVYGEELPPTLIADLAIVRRNSEHLTSMINDVLALSQAEAGQLTLRREWVDLSDDIDRAGLVVKPLLEKKQLTWHTFIEEDLPRVHCDRTRIRQVILNLVSNAARFTNTGGITVRAIRQGSNVVVSITDTGPGIVPEDAARIFEPFQQSTGGLWRDGSGSGLGLSISKQFIERHDGQIWLESEPGIGSTFSFQLPVDGYAVPSAASPGRWMNQDWVFQERTTWPKAPGLPNRPRVLLCDESGVLSPLLQQYADSIEVVDVGDLQQASDELARCPSHVAIFNAASPTLLASLMGRARVSIPDTPCIGCYIPPPIDRALNAGAMDYLIKPITRLELHEAMRAIGGEVRRVLIVDDDAEIRLLYSRMVQLYDPGLEIVMAASGREALRQLRKQKLDLVLLDIVLPDIDGWQVLEAKSEDAIIRDIPLIVISAEDLATQAIKSELLVAATGQGISVTQLLHSALHFSRVVTEPARPLDPASV